MSTGIDHINPKVYDNSANMVVQFANFVRRHAVLLVIAVAILIRLPLAFLPLTYSAMYVWRQADTASIAHNFVYNGNILYPQINWGGNGPGYVEAEFQFYTYIVSRLYNWFGEQVVFGCLISLLFTVVAFVILRLDGPW